MFNQPFKDAMQTRIQRDSGAWVFQVWASFLIAIFLCSVGLAYLPGKDLDRAFMVMGYFFCLSAAFVLAKHIRDTEKTAREGKSADTPAFKFVVWGGFFLAMSLTGWGLWRMEVNETYKAFLSVSWLYLITSTFTLAKTLRDRHEADLAEARFAGQDDVRREARELQLREAQAREAQAREGRSAS
jgi:hypothetical protein